MRVYDFGRNHALPVDHYESRNFMIARIFRGAQRETALDLAYLEPGGVIGKHPTGLDQLFMVVNGRGWVSGPDGKPEAISAGQAAFWQRGEEHETRTDNGLIAVIVQSNDLAHLLPDYA